MTFFPLFIFHLSLKTRKLQLGWMKGSVINIEKPFLPSKNVQDQNQLLEVFAQLNMTTTVKRIMYGIAHQFEMILCKKKR